MIDKTKAFNNPDIFKKVFFFLVVTVFIQMLTLNFLTPFVAEDFVYSLSTSILDALRREYQQYMSTNGRSVAHFIARLILMMPKGVFNVFNSIIFTGLTLLIYRIANPKKPHYISLYLFIISSIWLYVVHYGKTILWLTGSINYLWGTFFILCFLLPYNLYISNNKSFNSKYISLLGMFLLGIIAGWCNENTSGGAILFVILTLIYCRIFKRQIMKWMISGLTGNVIGFLFLILAPGNYARSQNPALIPVDDRHILIILASRITNLTNRLRNDYDILIIIFIVLITMQIILFKDWKRIYISFAFFFTSIATTYALVLSPGIANRALFGATIFMIIACAHCFAGLSSVPAPYKIATTSLIIILVFSFTTSFIVSLPDIGMTWQVHDSRQKFIESEAANGNLNITVPEEFFYVPKTKHNPLYEIGDLTHEDDHYINLWYADYYGLESIKGVWGDWGNY